MIARLGLRSWKAMRLWLLMLAIVGVPFAVNPVRMAKEDNERHQCTNNLKQIALGLYNYASDFWLAPSRGAWAGIDSRRRENQLAAGFWAVSGKPADVAFDQSRPPLGRRLPRCPQASSHEDF